MRNHLNMSSVHALHLPGLYTSARVICCRRLWLTLDGFPSHSPANSYYFKGEKLEGLGSPHTPHSYIWSMALCIQGLTSQNAEERLRILRMLLEMQVN